MKNTIKGIYGYIKGKDYCTAFPDGIAGVKFGLACYIHDQIYSGAIIYNEDEGNIKFTRLRADKLLYFAVLALFTAKGKYWLGVFVATLMLLGTRIFGWSRWTKR